MKKALVVLLVVVVLATGIPIFMSMGACPDCRVTSLVAAGCTVAILAAGVALAVALVARRLRAHRELVRLLLASYLLERPPRLA